MQLDARLQTAYRFELDAAYSPYLERGDVAVAPSAWSGAWLTVGFVLGLGEVFAGYEAIWIGGAGPRRFLGGLVVGMRAYF